MSEEHKRKISEAHKAKGELHWCKRPEIRESIRQTLLGHVQSQETIQKRVVQFTGKKHWQWKGARAGYVPIHSWVVRQLGRPDKCEQCGKIGYGHQMHWANLDHAYKRNLTDWVRLCAKCHMKYDLENGLRKLGAICMPR